MRSTAMNMKYIVFCQGMSDPELVKNMEEEVNNLKEEWKLKTDFVTKDVRH